MTILTELDEEIGPLATELIDEFGKVVQYKIQQTSGYNPETSSSTVSGDAVDIKAVVESVKGKSLGQGLIEIADLKLSIASSYFTTQPSPLDIFIVDNEEYTVLKDGVKAIYSGELIAMYEVRIEK